MTFLSILYLVSVALLITLFFEYILSIRGPWGSFWSFFAVILLGVVAADLWVTPIGPFYMDIYWIPPLISGLFIALILAAATPPTTRRRRSKIEKATNQPPERYPEAVALGGLFWFLLLFMLMVVVVGIF